MVFSLFETQRSMSDGWVKAQAISSSSPPVGCLCARAHRDVKFIIFMLETITAHECLAYLAQQNVGSGEGPSRRFTRAKHRESQGILTRAMLGEMLGKSERTLCVGGKTEVVLNRYPLPPPRSDRLAGKQAGGTHDREGGGLKPQKGISGTA